MENGKKEEIRHSIPIWKQLQLQSWARITKGERAAKKRLNVNPEKKHRKT